MNAARLDARAAVPTAKVWGRRTLSPWFADVEGSEPVGEVIFPPREENGLLIKFIFTSEPLSVQVHPDDRLARDHGLPGGKEEFWLILDAEPDARVGLGLTRELEPEALAASAQDGSLEHLLDWKRVSPGQAIHVPPGTIHALGAGLALVEVQQNNDVTYRLYDYGRPRELHLDKAVAAASPVPSNGTCIPVELQPGHVRLVDGAHFEVHRLRGPASYRIRTSVAISLVPLGASTMLGDQCGRPGTVWELGEDLPLRLTDQAELLIAYGKDGAAPVIERDDGL